MTIAPFSFEDTLQRLDVILAEFKSGQLSLDEALGKFEQGVGMIRDGQAYLKTTKEKVEVLVTSLSGESDQVQDFTE
jgi:exodeoxyribonuclease VII small subunit